MDEIGIPQQYATTLYEYNCVELCTWQTHNNQQNEQDIWTSNISPFKIGANEIC
jgi:hypothetical protein